MSALETQGKPLKARHVLAMFVGGFGVIIAVNLTLAYNAVATFPGVETPNVYVTSQRFDADRAAQDALGWQVTAAYADARLTLAVTDQRGAPVQPQIQSATLGRATTVTEDRVPQFDWDGQALTAPAQLDVGNWNLRLELRAADGTVFRRRIPLQVAP